MKKDIIVKKYYATTNSNHLSPDCNFMQRINDVYSTLFIFYTRDKLYYHGLYNERNCQ